MVYEYPVVKSFIVYKETPSYFPFLAAPAKYEAEWGYQ
jgi:hypothetical protein